MSEQQPADLLARVEQLEKQTRRQEWRQRFTGTALALTVVLLLAGKFDAWRGHVRIGGGGSHPGVSMRAEDDASSVRLSSSRGTAAAAMHADRSDAATSSLMYDGTMAVLTAKKNESTLRLTTESGKAEAAATADETGFYLYDRDNNLRAALSLTKQGPALIFYDTDGKELRRLRAVAD